MLIQFDDVCLDFAERRILQQASWVLEPKERVCLVGRNGAGKSTLMKLITRELQPDEGEIRYKEHLSIAQLQQALPDRLARTVSEVVAEGLSQQQALLDQYHALVDLEQTPARMRQLSGLQKAIEAHGGWNLSQQVQTIMTQLDLPQDSTLEALSGGWRRRVLLAKALVSQPDVLLLDEPTNHLDIATIEWLEQMIRHYAGAVVFVTHDRYFLQQLATRILEIDRGQLSSYPGNYTRYLNLKAQALAAEKTQNELFDKKLAQEEAWIRQGVKARGTRNMGRVRALEQMREQAQARIKPQGLVKFTAQNATASARKVIEARSVSHGYQGQQLLDRFFLKVMRGERIGLIGNNGLGKSTLVQILLTELKPDSGSVKLGENLEIAYFDQNRQELELDKTVAFNVGQGRDYIQVNGKDRHVIGYLKSFLFSPKRAMTPVGVLSGGERNRVLLAKLFAKPSNLLVLDEPTNDLDVEMLEVLEQQLLAYKGTLLVVSHDRQFLDNVVTSTLVFEGDGQVHHYQGGYSDWLHKGKTLAQKETPSAHKTAASCAPAEALTQSAMPPRKKLSFNEQQELKRLPVAIEQLEAEIDALQETVADPAFYQQAHAKVEATLSHLAAQQALLDRQMARWLELAD